MKADRRAVAFAFLALVLLACAPCLAQSLQVDKVEPPNWWIGMPYQPVMLLVYGEGLSNAKVTTEYPGVSAVVTKTPNAYHLFVWMKVAETAKPGQVTFTVESGGEKSKFSVELMARSSQQGKFQGINQDDILYLIMPDRFANGDPSNDVPKGSEGMTDRSQSRRWHGGDLAGVTQHLDYIHELGATAVWLTPWWKQNPGTSDYHGYGTVDMYAVDPHLGTMKDLQDLVASAHARGMKVVMDCVPNHTGPAHPWAKDPPTGTWLHGTPQHHPKFDWHFEQLIDPHATRRMSRDVVEGWFADVLPDINGDDPYAAEYLIANSIWWTEMTGLDGYRLDTFPYSSLVFWNEWHTAMFKMYPHSWSVGEVQNGDPWITSYFIGGQKRPGVDTKLTTDFDFPSEFALRKVFGEGASLKVWVGVLQHDDLYAKPNGLVTLLGNHDDARFANLKGMSVERFDAATALLMTMRGIPQWYSGDEIYMHGGNDPDNRRDFPGGFPGDTRNVFHPPERTAEEQTVFANTQALMKLRREHKALRDGRMYHLLVKDDAYAFARIDDQETLLIIFNGAAEEKALEIPLSETPLEGMSVAGRVFGTGEPKVDGDALHVALPASGVGIFRMERTNPK